MQTVFAEISNSNSYQVHRPLSLDVEQSNTKKKLVTYLTPNRNVKIIPVETVSNFNMINFHLSSSTNQNFLHPSFPGSQVNGLSKSEINTGVNNGLFAI